MTSPKELSPHERILTIRERALTFFKECVTITGPPKPYPDSWQDYFEDLPKPLKDLSGSIDEELVELAHLIGPTIRRSPLLTEADDREAGHAIKGMRSALRLRRFRYWGTEILHDEGVVLGVQKSGEEEDKHLHPEEAKEVFVKWSNSLQSRLALINPQEVAKADSPLMLPAKTIAAGYRPGTAFIMMWMSSDHPELKDVSNTVKRCFKDFGIEAMRSDDIEHEDVITNRILDQIKTAEFLFADLTGERPSVYYEVGYAHAIGRRVILYRKNGTKIHFDLAAYNCPEYENLEELEAQLRKRLEYATGKPIKKEVSD